MNNMNMAAMNPAAGGPVGGGMPMMNAATPNMNMPDSNENLKVSLNTHIYDYFLKNGYHDCARALVREEKIHLNTSNTKQSPGRQVNGVDDMDTDKTDIPDDLPRPKIPETSNGSSFLFDWYCLFSDMFNASRAKGKPGGMSAIKQYLMQTEVSQPVRACGAQLIRYRTCIDLATVSKMARCA